ncbi:MAG: proline--tRNA ligase [Phycisphaeraceae bacterium]|nr:proline--tRNA ligase [Phycisphaeraceae bacterium]
MPTFWKQSLIPTARQVPAEAEVPSHQLMIRAGLIRKVSAGLYCYLPLGWRSLWKAANIVREEMNQAGATEVHLTGLQPIELWEQTGRRAAYGDNLFVLADRHNKGQAPNLALGPTHEEVVTDLVGAFAQSYRDLPLTLYQIQTKFRDEYRPRFGVLRSREFLMKDAYSFHMKLQGPGGLEETYQKQYDAYCRIFKRCGLTFEIVEAESGPIGGSASHEFMVPSPTGEDTILKSDKGNYAANVEKCEIGPRKFSLEGLATGELEKVHTPGCPGIDDVCKFLKVKAKHMLKTLVCQGGDKWIVAVVRGDHDLNEGKLRAVCGMKDVHLADEREARAAGFVIGFVGPQIASQMTDIQLFIDPDAAQEQFWVTGANDTDHHVKHFNWKRDVLNGIDANRVKIADIRNAKDSDPSPKHDGGILRETKGIEIGHVFKLGDKYTRAMNINVLDEQNNRSCPIMGCYGIGVNRILASAIEQEKGHDADGIVWPVAIAPYQVVITTIKYEGAAKEAACSFAEALEQQGIDVLIDDRDERPGVKFKDADLIGFPIRVTLGEKGLAEGKFEIKARNGSMGPKGELVPRDEAMAKVIGALKTM